jgi:hypothetical protein
VIRKIRAFGRFFCCAHAEKLLGGGIVQRAKVEPHSEPNWAAANENLLAEAPKK